MPSFFSNLCSNNNNSRKKIVFKDQQTSNEVLAQLYIIANVPQFSAEQFSREIYQLNYLETLWGDSTSLPTHAGKNIFHAVLEHPRLNMLNKVDLLTHLFRLGYDRKSAEIIETELVNILLENPCFHDLLTKIYVDYIVHPKHWNFNLDLNLERKIWNVLLNLKDYNDIGVNLKIYHSLKCGLQIKALQYLDDCIKHINKKDKLLSIFDELNKRENFEKNQFEIKVAPEGYARKRKCHLFANKLLQNRMLTIILQDKDANEDFRMSEFLKSTNSGLFNFYQIHDSALEIYKMIKEKKPEAHDALIKKQKRLENNINKAFEFYMPYRFSLQPSESAAETKPAVIIESVKAQL